MPNQQLSSDEARTIRREVDALANMTAALEKRMDVTMEELPDKMARACAEAVQKLPLISAEEHEYLRLATRAAARREKLQQAIIEKTLSALIWSAISGLAIGAFVVLRDWGHDHLLQWLNSPRDPRK